MFQSSNAPSQNLRTKYSRNFLFFRQWAYYIVPFCLSEHFADARENSDKRKNVSVYYLYIVSW